MYEQYFVAHMLCIVIFPDVDDTDFTMGEFLLPRRVSSWLQTFMTRVSIVGIKQEPSLSLCLFWTRIHYRNILMLRVYAKINFLHPHKRSMWRIFSACSTPCNPPAALSSLTEWLCRYAWLMLQQWYRQFWTWICTKPSAPFLAFKLVFSFSFSEIYGASVYCTVTQIDAVSTSMGQHSVVSNNKYLNWTFE